MELEQVLKDFQDYLAPRLDTYEQAIYLYLFRHTRLIGVEEAVVGFKSARRRMACGVGEKGKPMSENTAYEKLRSLQKKGCIVILDSNRDGRKIRLKLPSEIPGVVVVATAPVPPDLEAEDFFEIQENRNRILAREGHHCFYCLRQLTHDNYVIEHITSRRREATAIGTSPLHVGSATTGRAPRLPKTGFGHCIGRAFLMPEPFRNGSNILSGCGQVNSSPRAAG